MAKSRGLEAALEQVRALQRLGSLEALDIEALRKIVKGKHSFAITPATQLIINHRLTQLIPDLISTFNKMLINGEKTDPGCKAKWAIANTLYKLEQPDADLFLSGIRHIQLEPVWGGSEDTAPKLRSLCALGLVQSNYYDALSELADLLVDPEHDARAGAARAIGYSENPAGIPMLRLKVNIGDIEPSVMSECFIALLKLSGDQSPKVFAALENGTDQIRELAAIALSEARIPGTFEAIRQQWKKTRSPELRQSFLLSIAILRIDEAIDFLIDLVARGNPQDAKDAFLALDIYRQTTEIWQQVTKAAKQRGDDALKQLHR